MRVATGENNRTELVLLISINPAPESFEYIYFAYFCIWLFAYEQLAAKANLAIVMQERSSSQNHDFLLSTNSPYVFLRKNKTKSKLYERPRLIEKTPFISYYSCHFLIVVSFCCHFSKGQACQ